MRAHFSSSLSDRGLTDYSTVGELAYNSTISGLSEFLPVTLSFIAAKGCVRTHSWCWISPLSDDWDTNDWRLGLNVVQSIRRLTGCGNYSACKDWISVILNGSVLRSIFYICPTSLLQTQDIFHPSILNNGLQSQDVKPQTRIVQMCGQEI